VTTASKLLKERGEREEALDPTEPKTISHVKSGTGKTGLLGTKLGKARGGAKGKIPEHRQRGKGA